MRCLPRPGILLAALLLLNGALVPARAAPMLWAIDPDHSRIVFFVSHDGYADAIGTFAQITGTLWFDPADWSTARVEAEIELATLNLGNPKLDQRIARRDYLDREAHPVARFSSRDVRATSDRTARVEGLLELRGTQVPVTLDVTLNKRARSAWSLRRTVGFSATTTLRRSAFGMSAHKTAVGDEVSIRIELEAVRARRERARGLSDQTPSPAPSPEES